MRSNLFSAIALALVWGRFGYAQPAVNSMSPSSGSGGSQTFTFTASSPNGFAYISTFQMLFNWEADGGGGCYVSYNASGNAMSLMNDGGSQWLGGYAPGSSNTVSNSQCTINLASTTVSGTGNTLTVKPALSFNSSFIGPQKVFGIAYDQGGNNTGWQSLGTWTPYAAPSTQPPTMSMTPASGAGISQMFSFHVNDLNGYRYIPQIDAQIQVTVNRVSACMVYYLQAENQLYLYNDAGSAQTSGNLGSATTLSNSQCSVDLSQTTTTGSGGNDLYLNVPIAFSAGFRGSKNIYQVAFDHLGQGVGWLQTGSWSVADPPLTITTPSLPAGMVNVAYPSTTLGFTGGSGSGYVWSATGLPAGVTLSAAGVLTGTPTAAGSYTVNLTLTDSWSSIARKAVTISVVSGLTITTSSLPAATAGSAYSQTLSAAGGTAPYTWTLLTGSLPAGITLSAAGLISGNTAATGTFSFTVQVTDIEYLTATAALSLTVNTGGGGGGSGGSSISWTMFTYDGIGRTLSVTQPDGASATHYSYSGNQTTVTDPAGNGKTFTSDVEGNLTTVVEPDPANAPSGTLTTSYTYDWMDHVSQVAMTRGATTQMRTFVYNDAGLLTSATNPENGTVSYTYNADNTLLYKHDAKGQDTVYSYDSKQRVTYVRRYPTGRNNAEDTCQAVAYFYDTNPFAYSSSAGGRLAATTYYAGNCAAGVGQSMVEMYSYHPAGGVTVKSVQAGTSAAQTVYYVYNAAGQVTTMTYPAGQPTYGYDGMGRLNSLTVPSQQYTSVALVVGVGYDVAGRMNSIQYPSGGGAYTGETMTYNVNGQLASLNWGPASSGYAGPVGGIQYSYSGTQNNGQLTQAVDTLSGETIGYQYDSLKRLTSASSTPIGGSSTTPWTQTYQYDGFGNLTAKVLNGTTTPIAVNPVANQLSNAYYDGNGNMTSGLGATLTYDVSNRLASAAETSGGIEYYGYAPDNKRVFRQLANGHQQITLYGAGGEKLSVYDLTTSTTVATYMWFSGMLISDGNPVYMDRLGTNRASGGSTTTNNGARFLPYGEEITSTVNDHVKFGTYARDSYTGLDYADQRFYASTYGRFTIPDPGASKAAKPDNPTSWNAYAYVKGDPVNLNDPAGLYDSSGNPDYCDIYWDDPFCSDYSPLPPNPGPTGPPPLAPQCSISLYERPVNVNLPVLGNVIVGEHLYIYGSEQYEDGSGETDNFLCEGGPANGKLVGGCVDGTNIPASKGSSGPSQANNVQVGATYTGTNACEDLTKLIISVDLYQIYGNFAPYRPIIGLRSTYGYNSNSYAFTLLNDIGLAGFYPNKNPYSWFGTPPNTPGWGRLVPGL